jgi:glucose/arabinose dehydrogenase
MSRFQCASSASIAGVALGAALLAVGTSSTAPPAFAQLIGPTGVRVTTLMSGLAYPWDSSFTPDGTMLLTEKGGRTLARLPDGTVRTVSTAQQDLFVGSESGLMGIVVDPGFAANRRYHTCQAYQGRGSTRSTSG